MWLFSSSSSSSSSFLRGNKPQTGSAGHYNFYCNNKILNDNLLKGKIEITIFSENIRSQEHPFSPSALF
jgi:hypothetical protein